MRITYICQYFSTPDQPGSTRLYETARRLARRGHEVSVVTSDRSRSSAFMWKWEAREVAGFTVHEVANPYANRMPYGERIRSFLRFAVASSIQASRIKADLLFASSTPLTVAIPAVLAKRRQRVPMVFEVRDLWPEAPIVMGALRNPLAVRSAQWLERFAYRNAERVIALSPGMKDGVARTGYPADRIHIIPNSSDVELFRVPPARGEEWRRAHPLVGSRPMCLYAGTLGRVNGVDWLARLAAELLRIHPEVCFVVVGHGNDETKVRQVATESGVLDRNFFMLPRVPKNELPAVFSACTLAFSVVANIPALWNNSSNKVFDTFAAGRPLAINHGGWQAELLEKHGAGLVLRFDDLSGAAKTVADFVNSPERVAKAGAAAAALADHQFNRDLLVEQLARILEETASQKGRR